MNEREFFMTLGKLESMEEFKEFAQIVKEITEELDELDCDDVFGTQGWKYRFGLED